MSGDGSDPREQHASGDGSATGSDRAGETIETDVTLPGEGESEEGTVSADALLVEPFETVIGAGFVGGGFLGFAVGMVFWPPATAGVLATACMVVGGGIGFALANRWWGR